MRRVLVVALLLASCSDPIGAAGNCSELLDAVETAAAEFTADTPIEELDDFAERVDEKAQAMATDAIARGAETEALICGEAASAGHGPSIRRTFDEISNTLNSAP